LIPGIDNFFLDDPMSGLRSIDVRDNKMLPTVYRRSDITRSANIASRLPPQGWQEGQLVAANDDAISNGYTRSRNNSPLAVKTGNPCPKGMIIDVWA
jgi:hypothetical protein